MEAINGAKNYITEFLRAKKLFEISEADELLKKIKGSKIRSNVKLPLKPDLQNAKKRKNTLPGPSRARSHRAETYTEANKDDAYRCLDLAENYIIEGDFEKAEKLINKSKQLYPTSKADELLKKLKANKQETEAQLDTVKKINSSKDLYDVLGIKKDATHTEIRCIQKISLKSAY